LSVLKSDSLRVTVPEAWEQILKGAGKARLEAALPDILPRQRWFGGKARSLRAAAITEAISLRIDKTQAILLFVEVTYRDGSPETYLLPVTAAFGDEAERIVRELPQAVLASVAAAGGGSRHGVLYDALWQEAFAQALLTAVGRGDRFSGEAGSLVTAATAAYPSIVPPESPLHACIMKAEQSNTSVQYGDRAMLKLYRRLQPGLNPDWELGRLLTASSFPFSPAVGGAIEYVRPGCEPMTVGLLQAFVPNEGDAWTMMLKAVESYLSRVPEHRADVDPNFGAGLGWWALTEASLPERARRLLGPALDAAARLGRRTAALHLALGQPREHPQLAPEPMTAEYRRMRYESMSRLWNDVGILLSNRQDALAISLREAAAGLLTREPEIHALFRSLVGIEDGGCRIRCHGDYHLGQVLWTGADYVIIDFEGEPARPLSERRAKQSPLLDVAGMLRSFDYAASAVQQSRPTEAADLEVERWTGFWSRWVGADFLKAYLAETGTASFGPRSPRAADGLLRVYLLEKAVYELGYELNNRPGWVAIPLKGIADILNMDGARAAAALGR
jgi:trehalose synthase-fused probable maltokinase